MRVLAAEALAALEGDLARLQSMSLADLRAFWGARWGFVPRLRSVLLLRHMSAWRLVSVAGRTGCRDTRTVAPEIDSPGATTTSRDAPHPRVSRRSA